MKESSRTDYVVKKALSGDTLWSGRKPLLPELDMELTERCNNNCIHCYINRPVHDPETEKREMTADRIGEILNEAAAAGCMTVRFTGGEPLLRHDFSDIYLYARRLGIATVISTNATLVTPELAALFMRYPPGRPLDITLYGMKKASYESVSRTRGSFDAAMHGIERLLENRIPFTLRGIRLPGRENEIPALETFAARHSADGKLSGLSMNFNLRARRDSPEKNRVIQSLRAGPAETLRVLTRDRAAYINEKKQFAAKFMGPGGPYLFTCGCGKGGTVDAYGILQPCLLLRHPETVYDLENGSLTDALTGFFPQLRQRKAKNPDYLERCARCFLKGLCEQCPAHSWMETGTLDTPVAYLCRTAHEQARFLGLMTAGEKAWEVDNWRERISAFTGGTDSGKTET